MPEPSDLPRNIILFSQSLRNKGAVVTTDSVLVALRGSRFVRIRHKIDFYNMLKATLVSRWEDLKHFDELFNQFWSLRDTMVNSVPDIEQKRPENSAEAKENQSGQFSEQEGFRFRNRAAGAREREKVDGKKAPDYSPDEILRVKDFSSLQTNEIDQFKEWVARLSRRMALMLSRRWKKGKSYGPLDFRRTIRYSVKYGGEILELKRKRQKPRPLQIVLLCDVSGSMDIYCQFVLLFMYVFQNFYPHCETLAFGTRLTRITDILKKKRSFNEVLHFLSREVLDWSGGTNIGGSLQQLRRRYPTLLHPGRTIFVLFSDGWERGDAKLLDLEMKNLKRLTRKLIWLNPHLGSPQYKPICKGMATALPYVDYFFPCHDLSSLRHLANLVPKI